MALRQESAVNLSPSRLPHAYRENAVPPLASENFDDVDEFEDAAEEHSKCDMDLQLAFEDCEIAIRKFFNNDIQGAKDIMAPWCRSSLYHSLGASIFEFIPAILTFDPSQISRTLCALKQCLALCNQLRRNYTLVESLGTIIKKPNYSTFTDIEAHAELCYAEALLLQAAMTIMEGEDLTGLIRGTIKVKNCYNSYKDCAKILEKKRWDCEESKIHFQSGVRLGTATFNLMISLLPPKIISVLEFVGFSGNKVLGLTELEAASQAPGMRSVLCDLTLLSYHLVMCHFIGANGDLEVCERILKKQLEVYPSSVWFLVFKGRLELLRGQLRPAALTYNRVIDNDSTWRQFRHVCYWEIMWVNGLLMEWREAARYAQMLIDESSWSRTVYSYTKAALLLQAGRLSPAERQHCAELLRTASHYKQRIAGKSLPMEKFMIRRAARHAAQGRRLVLPAVELLCLWNMLPVLAANERGAQGVLRLIEETRAQLEGGPQEWMGAFEADNRALLRYAHGCCLAAMGLPRLALEALDSVLELKNDIREDMFLLPYATAEMAMCHHQLGERERTLQLLNDARKKYSGYALESRLQFRMHAKIQMVKNEIAELDAAAQPGPGRSPRRLH